MQITSNLNGVSDDFVCPGTSIDAHAESVAMFQLRNTHASNKTWALAVKVLAYGIADKFRKPVVEDDIL
jgi:hypothetical protein